MSYSLNSLMGGYIGDYIGTTIGVIKGDTRSLDYSSYGGWAHLAPDELKFVVGCVVSWMGWLFPWID